MIAWSSAKRRSPWISTNPANSRSMKPVEAGPVRMARHLHALPRRQRRVDLAAHRVEPVAASASIARSMGVGPSAATVSDSSSFSSFGDRFFEVQRFSHTVLTDLTSATPTRGRRSAPPPRSASARAARGSGRRRRRARAAAVAPERHLDLERHAPIAPVPGEHRAERLEHAPVGWHLDTNRDLARERARARCRAAGSPTPAAAPTPRRAPACRAPGPACRSR